MKEFTMRNVITAIFKRSLKKAFWNRSVADVVFLMKSGKEIKMEKLCDLMLSDTKVFIKTLIGSGNGGWEYKIFYLKTDDIENIKFKIPY